MNLPQKVETQSSPTPQERRIAEVEAWVLRGLMSFWQCALPTDHAVFELMQSRAQQLLNSETLPPWSGELPWQTDETETLPLQKMQADHELSSSQLFVLALTGYVETTHLVQLAVAELQSPDRSPRLSLHLASAIAQHLFASIGSAGARDDMSVLAIAHHPLVRLQIMQVQGDGPLSLQRFSISPWFWAILSGRPLQWPGLTLCQAPSDLLAPKQQHELQLAAALLLQRDGDLSGLVLRGFPHSGRSHYARWIAHFMQFTAVEIPLEVWLAQTALQHACAYARWLPIIRLSSTPTASLRIATSAVPVILIAANDISLQEGNLMELAVEVPTLAQRKRQWQAACHDDALAEQLAYSAQLSTRAIQWIASCAQQLAAQQQTTLQLEHIREARARLGVEKLRLLAQAVHRRVEDDALIVPSLVRDGLQLVLRRARQRESLWRNLGATLNVTPTPGVRALFVGESGTGKTLAASYIATALAAPLYRVDLSAVMNKYIGESEKNLAQLLDYAAASDVVLLFDEADALFGNRSDGQENGERFANMLTNFLLTRIENHPGIVILTTNSRERIDNAFTRRLDVIVEFPMPDYEERLHLWRSHLGTRGPGDVVYQNLASYCDLAGGQLRNVVLTAASFAGENAISCEHLLQGLRAEYRKQGRPMPRKLEGLIQLDDAITASLTE